MQVVCEIEGDCSQSDKQEQAPSTRQIGDRAVQVMAEGKAEPAVDKRVQGGTGGVKDEEAGPAGERCSSQWGRHRIEPGNELGHQEER